VRFVLAHGLWILCAAIALKIGLHAFTVSQGRYFLASTSLQILVIALGAGEAARRPSPRPAAAALAGCGALAAAVLFVAPRAVARVRARDVDPPRTYRFSLSSAPGEPKSLDCTIGPGRLTALSQNGATLRRTTSIPYPARPPSRTASSGPRRRASRWSSASSIRTLPAAFPTGSCSG